MMAKFFQYEEELFHEVMEALGAISTTESQKAFRNWMRRLERDIAIDGVHAS
jgi:hypothetical protein